MNVNVESIKNDNPEDHSLEILEIRCRLTPREVEMLNELRGGDSVVEYVRRRLPVARLPEHIEQILQDQRREDEELASSRA